MKIAIIGAGFSGCNLYDNLKLQFEDITIFEKSRGVGGRLSTKYIDDKFIDHGTPFLIPITEDLKSFCSDLVKNKGFDKLFLTIPATQILEMNIDLEENIKNELEKINYDSVFSLILYSNANLKLNENLVYENSCVENIINNSKKYLYKDFSSYVIHSSRKFANEVNTKTKEEILEIFLNSFDEKTKEHLKTFNLIPHLWKFAFVKNSLDMSYYLNESKTLGICGDYFNFSNVEASLTSSELLGSVNF
jgi:predicted NAD/FAD-dependent oxidoreductase